MIPSYTSIYTLGHAAIKNLLDGDVIVEEKIDGSQFSFGLHYETGELECRSKGCALNIHAPEGMFTEAVNTAKSLAPILKKGWVYRGEYLQRAHHNTLIYDRTPLKNVMIFDISPGLESYLDPLAKAEECARIGLECVPVLFHGRLTIDKFRSFLENLSVLGGQKIEGVVIKPAKYDLYGPDKKVLMGKFVSEAFKELHAEAWKQSNPRERDILDRIGNGITTTARWAKAVQHLKESGKIENSPRDIGPLLKEVQEDCTRECVDEVKDALYKWAWPHLRRMTTRGFPEWYKEQLVKSQFGETTND